RRDIDPWYEDDLSVDYVELQGDVIWLDSGIVRADSVDFMAVANRRPMSAASLASTALSYTGQFAPEFEYEDWAMAWRGRVHAGFLELAHVAIAELTDRAELLMARDVAAHVIGVDPMATDAELQLVWIYGRMGMVSAARSQYDHLARQSEQDGLEPMPL